jgi:rhomboid protease GluP
MTPELLVLLAASLVALQIVSLVLRREHLEDAPYLGLLVADLAALVWVHVMHQQESMLAFVAEGIAAVLTLAPRFLDAVERSALVRDDFDRAARVAVVRELVMPGRTATRRRRQLVDLAQTRAGGGAQVVRRLRAELQRIDDPARAASLREDLATVLFFDRRFAEGVAEVEDHVEPAEIARRPAFAAYLLRAYGEVGRLDRAAAVMSLIEDGPAGRDPAAAIVLAQARLTFLAFMGRLGSVEALLATSPGAHLPPRAHDFLVEVARARASVEPPPEARELADTVFRRATLPEPVRRTRRRPRVTFSLIAANVAVFLAVLPFAPQSFRSLFGSGEDDGVLLRAGALFRPAVQAGQTWRLFTSMFLHAGWFHLAINMYGLYLLGQFTEEVFGPSRFLIIYLLGGLGGAISSTLVGQGALSVGASGAIMGLLGALIVTLILRRGSWPEAWRRAVLSNLLLLSALQIYIGFQVPMIDNAAHVGGMLGGAAATLIFAPGGLLGSGRRAAIVTRVCAVVLVAAVLISAGLAVRTPMARTLASVATREVELDGLRLRIPAYWEVDATHGRLDDPYLDVVVTPRVTDGKVRLESPQGSDPRYRALIDRIEKSARPVIMRAP